MTITHLHTKLHQFIISSFSVIARHTYSHTHENFICFAPQMWLTANKICPKVLTTDIIILGSSLTSASRNVAVFFLDVLVGSEAPRVGVDVRQHGRVAAVTGDVMDNGRGIRRVINEVLDVIIRMLVRKLVAPTLTLYSG